MKNIKNIVCASILCAIVCYTAAFALSRQWRFTHLDNNNGMSNSSANVIYQDRTGVVWIGTWDGLNRYDGSKFSQYHSILNDSTTLSHPVIRDIMEEDDRYLWIVTDRGINRFDKLTGCSRRFLLNSPNAISFAENSFICATNGSKDIIACFAGKHIYKYNKEKGVFESLRQARMPAQKLTAMKYDKQQRLWATTANRLLLLSIGGGGIAVKRSIVLPDSTRHTVFDNNGMLWIQTGQQLYTIGKQLELHPTGISVAGKLTHVCRRDGNIAISTDNGLHTYTGGRHTQLLHDINVTALMQGSQDILWAGTDGQGVYQYYAKSALAKSFTAGRRNKSVRAICQQGGHMLVGTKGEGLLVYDSTADDSLRLAATYDVGPGRTDNAVYALTPGLDGRVWVGTDGNGLAFYKDGRLRSIAFDSDSMKRQLYSVYSIVQTDDSTLYIGTSGNGLVRATVNGDNVKRVYCYNSRRHTAVKSDIVYAIANANPYLWIGSRGDGLTMLDMRNQTAVTYRNDPSKPQSLVSNDIISLCLDSKKRLWIGTTQGLDLMRRNADGTAVFCHVIGTDSRTVSKNIHNIQEDSFGNIWVSTSNGIVRVQNNLQTTRFTYRDGLQSDEFSDGAGIVTADKRCILFGGTNGLSVIYPQLIQNTSFMPRLTLNSFGVDGRQLPLADSYHVDNGTKTLEFGFSVLDFIDNERCELSYRLVRKHSIDSKGGDWTSVGNARHITLNELMPGSYVLQVRQSNSAHRWANASLDIPFHVAYPMWCRWWAILIYAVVTIAFVRSAYKGKMRRIHSRQRRELERQSQRSREDIHHAKLRFFANVTSHFSNNLTQVVDAVERIKTDHTTDIDSELDRIAEQTRQMKAHIRQMSEIQSAEDNDKALNVELVHIPDAIKVALDNYSATTMEKNISLLLHEEPANEPVATDYKMLVKALNNLLTYIMDNIHADSSLKISVNVGWQNVAVKFTYSGQLPDTAEHSDIFNSYKALDRFESNMSAGRADTTIRLTLANDIAKRLGGRLAISTPQEDTATLTVEFKRQPAPADDKAALMPKASRLDRIFNSRNQTIMIIKPDKDMAQFISDVLKDEYNIVVCKPEEWQATAAAGTVDIVICDVSGSSARCIDELRTNDKTMYVPIIAVCSEGEKGSMVESLRTGANSILEKPFHTSLLQTMVYRLIQEAAKMKNFQSSPGAYLSRYAANDMTDELRQFLAEAADAVSRNFADENYNPDSLAKDMTISRSQLYRKMKQAADMSPSDFILEYRMQQAERQLKQTTRTVSEIIMACGFRNRSFFYREFARRYNCLPREYRKK